MRHYVPKSILLKYYVEYQANNTIWLARLRQHEFFFLKPNFEYATKKCSHDLLDIITKIFSDDKILTVHELYVYDLMK